MRRIEEKGPLPLGETGEGGRSKTRPRGEAGDVAPSAERERRGEERIGEERRGDGMGEGGREAGETRATREGGWVWRT